MGQNDPAPSFYHQKHRNNLSRKQHHATILADFAVPTIQAGHEQLLPEKRPEVYGVCHNIVHIQVLSRQSGGISDYSGYAYPGFKLKKILIHGQLDRYITKR